MELLTALLAMTPAGMSPVMWVILVLGGAYIYFDVRRAKGALRLAESKLKQALSDQTEECLERETKLIRRVRALEDARTTDAQALAGQLFEYIGGLGKVLEHLAGKTSDIHRAVDPDRRHPRGPDMPVYTVQKPTELDEPSDPKIVTTSVHRRF
jgi:hypothetical protein